MQVVDVVDVASIEKEDDTVSPCRCRERLDQIVVTIQRDVSHMPFTEHFLELFRRETAVFRHVDEIACCPDVNFPSTSSGFEIFCAADTGYFRGTFEFHISKTVSKTV